MNKSLGSIAAAIGVTVLSMSGHMMAATVGIGTYAGLTIVGEIGEVYSIEYVTDLSEVNDPRSWRCLEFLRVPVSPCLWLDESTAARRTRFYRTVAMEPPENMVFIPPGTFRMGSPEEEADRWEDEGPQTDVVISRGFWMGRCEVTQRQYKEVRGMNPSFFKDDPNRPVDSATWYDAVAYCVALTEQGRSAGRIPADCVYRLPTEAEWEYACRAWSSTRFCYGDDPGYTKLMSYAWYWDNSDGQTHPVGQKLPNRWGLYDMCGNVWEWCQDWYGEYAGGLVLDPRGPPAGMGRVIRGGGWDYWYDWDGAGYCRSARRRNVGPEGGSIRIGFRVVLAPGQP